MTLGLLSKLLLLPAPRRPQPHTARFHILRPVCRCGSEWGRASWHSTFNVLDPGIELNVPHVEAARCHVARAR